MVLWVLMFMFLFNKLKNQRDYEEPEMYIINKILNKYGKD